MDEQRGHGDEFIVKINMDGMKWAGHVRRMDEGDEGNDKMC